MYTILGVLQVFIAVVLIFLVLLHSGKDAGLSGAFGVGGGGSSLGGGSMVERNLDRATVVVAILFAVNTSSSSRSSVFRGISVLTAIAVNSSFSVTEVYK